ncbi:MAG TPA: hypothetical protein VJI46_01035 [Candidatus Nanoarchaeia archaeon]|nr:hypothetical protein [Candidatus Nanoarchaeia archaeon]
MSPLRHLIVSGILIVALFPFVGLKGLIILISGVLIDIDHYFWYIAKKRDYSLARCYRFYNDVMEKKRRDGVLNALFVFHTLEFLVLVAIASFYSEYAVLFLIGYLFHVVPDVMHEIRMWNEKVVCFSVIQWLRVR